MTGSAQPSWVNNLPEQWSFRPLRHLVTINNSNVDKLTSEGEVPVRLCNYTDVYNNEFVHPGLNLMRATATPNEINRFRLRSDDVIITKDSESWDDIAVPACVTETAPDFVCGYHLTLLRPIARRLTGSFLLRVLQADGVREQFHLAANGVTRFGLTQRGIKAALIPLPPYDRQCAIANFLDKKTAAIDALIQKKERLIELLQEKRQALITQAVTKGLDPSVPMKDSGIEWLGEIPAHWSARRGRFLFRQLSIPPADDDSVVTAFRDGQVTLRTNRRTGGFMLAMKEVGYQQVRDGDLVLHSMDAFAGAIGVSESTGKCTPEYVVLEPTAENTSNHYYAAVLRWMALQGFVFVICPSVRERAPRFRYSTFKDVWLPVPPPEEQARIAEVLATAPARLDALVRKTREQLGRIREYRQALISAAVTGKIDVSKE